MHAALDVKDREVELDALGQALAHVRLKSPEMLRRMEQSLSLHGQLTPLVAYRRADQGLEVLDGFKRLDAARGLRLRTLRVQALPLSPPEAKAAIAMLNVQHGLEALEEAWLIRVLYRDDGLSQPQIARLLGRDKSWVCRRLALAESLHERLEADLRLGLISPSLARELARLPRGNQPTAADRAIRQGLTTGQVARLVRAALLCQDETARTQMLERGGAFGTDQADRPKGARPKTPAEQALGDVAILNRVAGRLQARLHEYPLSALGGGARGLVLDALTDLEPVLTALLSTLGRLIKEKSHASLVQS